MPQSATPNMGLIEPTEGGDDDVWDTLLTTVFGAIDSHDHTTGRGVKIPSAALKINADVSWSFGGVNYAITDAKALDFAAVTTASVSALAGALFVNSADNELYFRSIAGTNIKITSGTTLNVSIVGGIGGDYASVGALLDYDDATDTYRFRQETAAAVRQFAKVSMADLIIREYDAAGDASVPVETITVKSPDALAASYALTLLAALPSALSYVRVSTAGVLTAIPVSPIQIPAAAASATYAIGGTASVHTLPNGNAWALGASSAERVIYPINATPGQQITGISLKAEKLSDATNTLQIILGLSNGISTFSAVATFTASNSAAAPGIITLSPTTPTPYTVLAGDQLAIVVSQSDATPSGVDSLGVATYSIA